MPLNRSPRRALTALLLGLALLVAACGGGGSEASVAAGAGDDATSSGLNVLPASFDLAAGPDNRFMVGLLTDQMEPVGGGEVELRFARLAEDGGAQQTGAATASFLEVPGKAPQGEPSRPQVLEPDAAGVYETAVGFDEPGTYEVTVMADVDGLGEVSGSGAFIVAAEHQVPDVGDPAPASQNLTVDDHGDAPLSAVDSRADGGSVPDPALHDTTVAEALEAGRPTVVAVTTPVFCVSRFCGPITDEVAVLQETYGDRAEFVHIEVWRDFEAGELNEAAAEWIQTPEGGNEPWIFLVGPDGTIQARWDNVLDLSELETMLEDLPAA